MTDNMDHLPTLERFAKIPAWMEERGKKHIYHIGDEQWPSVTTRLQIIDKGGMMVGVTRKRTMERIRDALLERPPTPADIEEWDKWVDSVVEPAYKSFWKKGPKKRDEADVGTDAHAQIAELLNDGISVPLGHPLTQDLRRETPGDGERGDRSIQVPLR